MLRLGDHSLNKIIPYYCVINMSQRITVVLDDDIVTTLRQKQAKMITESTKSVSFSRVLNETLRKSIKEIV